MNTSHFEVALFTALRNALNKMFSRHKETFYYFAVVTDSLGSSPYLSAWSTESLARSIANHKHFKSLAEAEQYLRWSALDSPYLAYGYGDEMFMELEAIVWKRQGLFIENQKLELERRLAAMEKVVSKLDSLGIFCKTNNGNSVNKN